MVSPAKIKVTLIGVENAFSDFEDDDLSIVIDLVGKKEGVHDIPLEEKHAQGLPSGANVQQFESPSVKLVLFTKEEKLELPIKPVLDEASLPKELMIDTEKLKVTPDKMTVLIRDVGKPLKEIKTKPISLKAAKADQGNTVYEASAILDLPPYAEVVGKLPEVKVSIPLKKKEPNGGKPNGGNS